MSADSKLAPGEVRVEFGGVRPRRERGRALWRSLDQLEQSPEFLEFLHREFPQNASEFTDPEGRREFLRVMGASFALAGLAACTKQPAELIVPYVRQPEQIVPGRPLFFASAVLDGGYAKGVLVESHEGRPTKIEGNPEHPASLGGSDAVSQAAILDLYDPDRAQTVRSFGEIHSWAEFVAALAPVLEKQRARKGAGLRIVTEVVTSPTLRKQLEELLSELPAAKWVQWDAAASNARAGAALAFGEPVETRWHLDEADVVVSLDADFLAAGPASVRQIRDFASRRKLDGEHATLNRLYAIETMPCLAGVNAEHRLPVRPSELDGVVRALAAALGLPVDGGTSAHAAWIGPLAKDLQSHRGASLVMAGDSLSPAAHAIVHLINERLGNVGRTVSYSAPVAAAPIDAVAALKELVAEMSARKLEALFILGANPAYTAPADIAFADAMMLVPFRVHLSLYDDETSERCHWQLPEAHSLEAWSDALAFDGTATIVQPLIEPLYVGKSAHELLALLTSRPDRKGYDIVRDHWRSRLGADFEKAWRRALHDGLVAGTAFPEKAVAVKVGDWTKAAAEPPPASGIEVVFRPDPTVGDGRGGNNGWLQELPKPVSKLTWENAVYMSLATAKQLGVRTSSNYEGRTESAGEPTPQGTITDVVQMALGGRKVSGPAWVVPGHPDGVVTVHLGYGRWRAGRVGNGAGFNAYALRSGANPHWEAGAQLVKTAFTTRVACTQDHWSMEGRHLVRAGSLDEFEHEPRFAQEMGEDPPKSTTFYPPHAYEGHAWALTVDLNTCVGCNACVTACQSENNVPVVGKDQVARGREMHWIRVDRYFEGRPEQPDSIETWSQPVMCMHCENAPCEVVCPVTATVHSDEGLNDMIYNRCVGTRYCSNNCPYKVRRFNFYLYQDWTTSTFKMMRNPDVSIRSRGVMEKCTYCVQRISKARIDAKNEGRPIREGEIQTACQQACPAEAIVFGDQNDAKSRVAKLKASPRNYGLLTDLNTLPRTTYLAAVRNPNPEMPKASHG
ncbi:MAG TPA: TAT-variant-translocated molybdopterin oxidoreductase [Vicinamibacteria bacterium]|nr:TAT-variant-translocated molybdopterin oxidoreductase [Vicinamibacteria bacterium]